MSEPAGATAPVVGGLGPQVGSAVRWSVMNSAFTRVSQVAVGILLARLIAPEQFGVYAAALVVLNIVLSVSEMGVSVALVRMPGDISRVAPTVTTLSLLSGSVLAIACGAGAPWFADALNAPEATGLIRVMALALVVGGASAVPAAILQREFRQDLKLAADVSSFLLGTLVAVVLALLGFGAWSLAWSRVVTNVAAAAVMFASTKERYRPGFDKEQAKALLSFGLPLAGSSLLVFAVLNVDYIVVGSVLGPVALGLYLLAFNLSSWPVGAISLPVRSVALPAFARLQTDPEGFCRGFLRAVRVLALFSVPPCVLLASLGGPLVRFVYGSRWGPAAAALSLLAVLGGLRVLLELAYDALASAGRSRAILLIHVLWLVSLAPVLVAGARADGIRGVALGHVATVLVLIAPSYLLALRALGIRSWAVVAAMGRPLAGGLVMVLAAFVAKRSMTTDVAQLAVGTALAAGAYLVVVFPLRQEALTLLRRRPSPDEELPCPST